MSYIIPKELQEKIKNNNLVVFVGAGVSLDLGYPSWEELVSEMIKDANSESGDKRYQNYYDLYKLSQLSILELLDKLDNKVIRNTLERVIVPFEKKIENNNKIEVYEKILDLSKKIMTTNYDNTLDKLMNKDAIVDERGDLARVPSAEEFLFKIHGTINRPSTCIVKTEGFEKIYGNDSPQMEILKGLALKNSFLFIGFSMTDPYLQEVFMKLNRIFEGYSNTHYLITTDERKDLEQYNIKSIPLKSYDELVPCLDQLINYKFQNIGIKSHNVDVRDNHEIPNFLDLKSEFVGKRFDYDREVTGKAIEPDWGKIRNEIKVYADKTSKTQDAKLYLDTRYAIAYAFGYYRDQHTGGDIFPISKEKILDYIAPIENELSPDKELEAAVISMDNPEQMIIGIDIQNIHLCERYEESADASKPIHYINIQPVVNKKINVLDGHHAMKLIGEICEIVNNISLDLKKKKIKFIFSGPIGMAFLLGRYINIKNNLTIIEFDKQRHEYVDTIHFE